MNRYANNRQYWQCGKNHNWIWKIEGDWAYGKCRICGAQTAEYIPFAEEVVYFASMDADRTEDDSEARNLHPAIGMRRQEMDNRQRDREKRL